MDFDQNFPNKGRVLEPLWFEKVDVLRTREWVGSYQAAVIYASVGYLLLTFLGREWMRNRNPYKLKWPLFTWNLLLAIFSTFGFLRTAPTLLTLLTSENGVYRTVCTLDYTGEQEIFWGLMYTLSKPLEFVDTFFIVLKKAPLLFLHLYHHFSMSIFMFYLYPIGDPVGRVGGILNFFIHSIMYFYYCGKTVGVHIPKRISSVITVLQMLQFAFTILANIYALLMIGLGHPCILSNTTIVIQFTGGISYLALFANYFYQTYVKRKPKSA